MNTTIKNGKRWRLYLQKVYSNQDVLTFLFNQTDKVFIKEPMSLSFYSTFHLRMCCCC